MKLQIEGQQLRVRIVEEELARLLGGEALYSVTRFAKAFALRCTLELAGDENANIGGSADDWRIALPKAAVHQLAARLPSREGLNLQLAGSMASDALTLLFDVDVRDSLKHRRRSSR